MKQLSIITLTVLLFLSLVSCGSSAEAPAEPSPETPSASESAAHETIDLRAENFTVAYVGLLGDSTAVVYATTEEGARGILTLANGDTGESRHFLGERLLREDGWIQITNDDGTDFTFALIPHDDGSVSIDLTADGIALASEATVEDAIGVIEAADSRFAPAG